MLESSSFWLLLLYLEDCRMYFTSLSLGRRTKVFVSIISRVRRVVKLSTIERARSLTHLNICSNQEKICVVVRGRRSEKKTNS
uniref:Uncharacterized protein n=1 Tax=Lepeophtheirus salmonis TaxID=72036 RepID=A0A0K2V7X4_LEPSM